MNSKLTILAGDKPLALGDDFSINVELSNPLFNDNEMFSYPVSVPLEGNRHVLKNVDDINADLRPVSYEHTPMRIIADGVPFANGTAIMQEDELVEDALSINIDASQQSFDQLISDLQCRDIPIPEADKKDLLIGQKIGNLHVEVEYKYKVQVQWEGKKGDTLYSTKIKGTGPKETFEPQALGFSFPGICNVKNSTTQVASPSGTSRDYEDGTSLVLPSVKTSFINVTDAYGESTRYTGAPPAKFCNARVCYKHYDKDDDGFTSSDVVQGVTDKSVYEDHGPLWVLDADRPQSGICFYVLYFLDCLFAHLDVQFDKSALLEIEDFKRLCFFTTHCKYDTKPAHGEWYTEDDVAVKNGTKRVGAVKSYWYDKSVEDKKNNDVKKISGAFDGINQWLSSRCCGAQLSIAEPEAKNVESFKVNGTQYAVGSKGVQYIKIYAYVTSAHVKANILNMYANSDNFPDESVSTVLDALENAFGIKFHYDYEQKKVTAYLIRDVFRKQNPAPRTFNANILSMVPMSEKITGVRMRYSEESDAKDQQSNVKNGVRDYNTDYDYIDYPDPRDPSKGTIYYEHLFKDIFRNPSNGNMHTYIDLTTGNAYRIKIDSEATSTSNMNARVFQVGQWKGVEYGDCSEANEDFIQDYSIDFTPITFTDANYRFELMSADSGSSETVTAGDVTNEDGSAVKDENGNVLDSDDEFVFSEINKGKSQPVLAAFVDEDMEHEFVEQQLCYPLSTSLADFNIVASLKLVESYDPSDTDDGNSPLQSYDWGLSVAMMRGGGNDMTTQVYDGNYDGFGNSKWGTVSGQYALTSDTIDQFGNQYDYNGTAAGLGDGERFSLKIRAYKQPEWSDVPLCNENVRNRGLFETFMIDLAYFLLNRHKYHVKVLASVAQIADIPNHWREWWNIGGKKCLINKVNTDISVKDGMGEVEMEVYAM